MYCTRVVQAIVADLEQQTTTLMAELKALGIYG